MKLLLLLVVIAVVIWMITTRRRPPSGPAVGPERGRGKADSADPARMISCARCGVHLPQTEALTDGASRPFCSEAHRAAGPR